MTTSDERSIVLASGSPRRRELLEHIGFRPVVKPTNVPEVPGEGEAPADYARRLAEEKAAAAVELLDDDAPRWILAADTIVVHDGVVLEKPTDATDAVSMLSRLSGSWHEVITAFCWRDRIGGASRAEVVVTEVEVRHLEHEWIDRYVASGEPMDKAGGYGIQDVGATLVQQIRGSYSSVVGLPLCEAVEVLEELGGLHQYPFVDE